MKNDISPRIRPRVKIIKGFPELLPFVSVFFLLTVFFMMGSSFVPVSGIPVNLPTARVVGTYSVKKYIVTIDRNGNIYFNDMIIENLDQLKSKLLTDVASLGENAIVEDLKIANADVQITVRSNQAASCGFFAGTIGAGATVRGVTLENCTYKLNRTAGGVNSQVTTDESFFFGSKGEGAAVSYEGTISALV